MENDSNPAEHQEPPPIQHEHTHTFHETRAEKIKAWFKNPYNLTFVGILILAFSIRLYYFILTKNQPLWWDEAEYMSGAKSYAGLVDYHYNIGGGRLPGLPMLMSLFFMTGLSNEVFMRFFALFIPAIILILLTYFTVKEMYSDRRIALISMAIMAVLWENLFYSNRFQTENISLIFQLAAFAILFKCYVKNENLWFIKSKYSLAWVVLFSAIAVMFRSGSAPFTIAILLFIVFINKSRLLTKRNLLVGAILAIPAIFAMLWFVNHIMIPSRLYNPELPISWVPLTVFYGFYESVIPNFPSILFYLFILGIIILMIDIIINKRKFIGIENNSSDIEFKSDVFNALLMISVLGMFIFFLRPAAIEYRYFFSLIPALFIFTAKGIITLSDYAASFMNFKKLSIILILLIISLGLYNQVMHSDGIIKMKADSYDQVRESGIWIKEHSSKEDVIVSASTTQHTYYSERKVYGFYVNGSNENEIAFDEKVKDINPRYLVISAFEPGFTPSWAYTWPQRHNESIVLARAWFADAEQKQPLLVIYEFKK